MGLLNPAYAPVLPFKRPTEDADGNVTAWTDLGTFPSAIELTGPGVDTGTGRRYAQGGTIFVPRGSGVKIGDHFVYNGDTFAISSSARGNQDHIFTGADFGWIGFDCLQSRARWS